MVYFLYVFVFLGLIYFIDSLAKREKAKDYAARLVANYKLQFLDDSIYCSKISLVRDEQAIIPPAMAIRELTATSPEIPDSSWADITLKPNQPTVKIHEPSAKNGMLEGGNATKDPSFLYLPWRAPKINTAASAIQPPKPWTTIDPAKS